MRKLKLDLDNVTVESFTPQPAGGEQGGTVHGHDHRRGHNSCQFSCWAGCTFEMSCYNPCATTTTGIA